MSTTFYGKKNNAKSTITNNPLSAGGLSITLASSTGGRFPAATAFLATIWDAATYSDPFDDSNMEIVKCDSVSGDTVTVNASGRGFAGTTAVSHATGSAFRLLIMKEHTDQYETLLTTLETGLVQKDRTIEASSDKTIASATPAAVGSHAISITIYNTTDVVLCSFLTSFFSSDTTSYYAFSIGYDSTSRIQAGSQVSFLGGAGEGNRKLVTITDVITGLSAGTYSFKPFWVRTSGTGTGTSIKDTSVFTAVAIRQG